MSRLLPCCVIACAVLALSACSSVKVSKKGNMLAKESFDSDGTYSRSFPREVPEQVCQAAYRALLSQGYVAANVTADSVEAVKNFQPEAEVHEQMTVRVSCLRQVDGTAWVFASAQQDRYNMRKSNNSASLGVSALGSVSLPIGSTDDSLVKVGSMTVQDAGFYRAFFKVVERFLPPPSSPESQPQPQPESVPAPAPVLDAVPDTQSEPEPEPQFEDSIDNKVPVTP